MDKLFNNQQILPAARNIKDLERLLQMDYEYIVILDTHIGHLQSIMKLVNQHKKKVFLHMELIHGIQSDAYGTEYICQEFKPYGIMSTKTNVILKAKQNGVIAVQRIFLLDSGSLTKSYSLLEKTKPDYIEVLPGAMPSVVEEVKTKTLIPILAGGFIRTVKDVKDAIKAGATAVTTSQKELWQIFEK